MIATSGGSNACPACLTETDAVTRAMSDFRLPAAPIAPTAVGVVPLWASFVGMAGALVMLFALEAAVYGPWRLAEPVAVGLLMPCTVCLGFSLLCFVHACALTWRFRARKAFSVSPARAAMALHGGLIVFHLTFGVALPRWWLM